MAPKKRISLYACFIDLTKRRVRLRRSNTACPLRYAVEDDSGHLSIPQWHAGMIEARRLRALTVVAPGTRFAGKVCSLATSTKQFFAAVIHKTSTRFEAGKDITDAMEGRSKITGAGESNGRESNPGGVTGGGRTHVLLVLVV